MLIKRHLKVPTGDIIVVNGVSGPLEVLSLGDYGKEVNLNQHKPVPDGLPLMPLTEKWVVTISTQYGCSMNCDFCDVPQVGIGKNATLGDMTGQIITALSREGVPRHTKRLNIHFARMGEPTWNPNVLDCAEWASRYLGNLYNPHPVVSTMMPHKNKWLKTFIHAWMHLKNHVYQGNAGLQLSINSTDEDERADMFDGNAHTLRGISEIMRGVVPVGRKITLNFAVSDSTVDPDVLLKWFIPEWYIIKLTPMHKTSAAVIRGIKTEGDYTSHMPYMRLESRLRAAGYDVLVFIASHEEDASRITCGNAILSGTLPHSFTEVTSRTQGMGHLVDETTKT